MKFHVDICETVTEVRTYEVEADNRLEAAKKAAHIWLDQGIGVPEVVDVEERDYAVVPSLDPGSEPTVFSLDEVESDEEEAAAA